MKTKPFAPGHLKTAIPTFKQTEESRYLMSKKSRQHWTLQKLVAPELNWKRRQG